MKSKVWMAMALAVGLGMYAGSARADESEP